MNTETTSPPSGLASPSCCPSLPVPFYDRDGITIYHGDNRQILPLLDDFDLLLTDPPYGLGERLKGGTKGEWSKGFETAPEWDTMTAPEWMVQLAIAKSRWAILWGGNYYQLPPARGWLGWDKMQEHSSGHYELAWTNLEIPTRMYRKSRVESYSRMGKVHPTQKPEELMGWCMNHAPEAKTICDPWMGSGTTLVAAKARGLRAVGIDASAEYCKAAVDRLAQDVLQFSSDNSMICGESTALSPENPKTRKRWNGLDSLDEL